MKPLLLCALVLATALPVLAQTQQRSAQVYRCGPEGRDLRDSPCTDAPRAPGSTIAFDEPSAADRRAAQQRHAADSQQAAALARARSASEVEARRRNARHASLSAPPPVAQPASAPAVVQLKPPRTAKPRKPAADR
jgi:hypothetical protein